jgi:DNA-binding HxlR family transcriptional regulator
MADDATDYCPVFQHAVELIGRRWTASIIKVLGERSLRFGEIRSAIPGLSDRLLVARLTELESEGIVARSESDADIRYAATQAGLELGPIFDSIGCWAAAACGDPDRNHPGRRRC